MRLKTLLLALLILSFSSFFVMNCAGTKKEDGIDSFDTEKSQRDDLDDIEALLGISSDKSEKQQTSGKKEEQLDLLESGEVTAKQTHSSTFAAAAQQEEERKLKEKEVQQLKNQMKQKDRKIAELNALVDEQDSEIQKMQKSGSAVSFASTAGAVSMDEYQSRYDEARSAFEARQYQQAIQYFESLLAASATHSLADNAQFWIGECHFALRQYDAAIIDFEKVLTFPNSNKKADAQYKLVYCYLQKGSKEKARDEFDRLKADFPDSHFNAQAQRMLSK